MTTASRQDSPRERCDVTPVMLGLYAETPLHPGTGQSAGVVDLPVQRERHTGFPIIPSSSLKGSLRRAAERHWGDGDRTVEILFGPKLEAGGGNEAYAGALTFTDARLLAFPVRSLSDVFLWVTCPLLLGRLARDLRLIGVEMPDLSALRGVYLGAEEILVADGRSGTVVLEDISFQAVPNEVWADAGRRLAEFLPGGAAHSLYREKFARHVALISDSDFSYLVKNSTQVTARIALDENKTTSGQGGNLWYEETLPPDSLFSVLVLTQEPRAPAERRPGIPGATDVRNQFLELVGGDPRFLQVGGNETLGHGLCAVRVVMQGGTCD